MYTVSESAAETLMKDCRCFKARLVFTNGTVLQDEVVSITVSMQTSEDDIRPGDVIPRNLSGELIGLESTILGQTFMLYWDIIDMSDNMSTHAHLHNYTHGELHSYKHGAMPGTPNPTEGLPAGEYKVTACTKQGDRWSIEAHDKLYSSDKPYNSNLTYPTSIANVEREICNALGLRQRDATDSITIPYKITGATCREMLGYLAGLQGKCCITDRLGKLAYKGLEETGYYIEPSRADEPEASQEAIKISELVCVGADNITYRAVAPGTQKRTVTFTDPLVDQRNFSGVATGAAALIGISYTPLTVSHRLGDPRLDILDIVFVRRYGDGTVFRVPLTSIELNYDGGIRCELAATASTDTQDEANQNNIRPMTKRIEEATAEVVTQIEAEMQEKVNDIIGENGGYVVTRFNADGQPIATYYSDNLDITQATDILVINDKGIAGTNNGLNGQFNVAISIDGTINASQILTGVLTAILLRSSNGKSKINLDTGELDFGNGTFSVDSNGNCVANSFTSNSATITGGSINVNTNTFSVDSRGNCIANSFSSSSATITGGSINIETDSESDDRITLSYEIYKSALAAYGYRAETTRAVQGIQTACIVQFNGIYGELYYNGSWRKIFEISPRSGHISTVGSVLADGNVSAGINISADGEISAGGNIIAGGNAAVSGIDGAVFSNDLYWKDSDSAGGYHSMRTFYNTVMNYINSHP